MTSEDKLYAMLIVLAMVAIIAIAVVAVSDSIITADKLSVENDAISDTINSFESCGIASVVNLDDGEVILTLKCQR